ncbi:hypothetical protein [Streptomyces sp.]|uniref:hypothetical protein n=1 Tax=Streptomyces sp. TaxID=1931 RepID=UPI0039C99016
MVTGDVRIEGNTLLLGGGVQIRFIRTLRLPESGTHPLPPGLGEFPLRRIEDFPGTVPRPWLARGGVMLPVYLREALWLSFAGSREPAALQIGVGKVCAVSGERWTGRLEREPQNYVVLPRQPWLDGINSGRGTVRQFVAVPLGLGATVEGQVTGEETTGGVQLQAFPLSRAPLDAWREEQRVQAELAARARSAAAPPWSGGPAAAPCAPAGAPGGGYGAAFPAAMAAPPPSPVDRAAYTRAGLPWFDYYDEDGTDLAPTGTLSQVKPVGEWLGDDHTPWAPPGAHQVQPLGDVPPPGTPVKDGDW